jgi:hypothetical protein
LFDGVLRSADDFLRANYNSSYSTAEQAFFGTVEIPMITAIVDFLGDGINRIQALEGELMTVLGLQSADIIRILYDNTVQHADLT